MRSLGPRRRHAGRPECGAQPLRFFNGNTAHQHRLAAQVVLLDFLDAGVEFFLLGAIDDVRKLMPDECLISGDNNYFQIIYLLEFCGLGFRRARHSGQLLVHAEIVLEGDGGQRLVFLFDLDAFLGLDGLVKSIAPSPARHQAAGELIHDNDFALFDHVVAFSACCRWWTYSMLAGS